MAENSTYILVARGTYYPTSYYDLNPGTPENKRLKHFRMKKGVYIYGGFVGNEDMSKFSLDNRDLQRNKTILSGDIGVKGDNSDNCYYDVYVNSDYDNSHPCWNVTHFDNLNNALSSVCSPGIVNISNYSHAGNVDMTGRAFIIGEQDFALTGNLSGGLIEVINSGKLILKDIAPNTTKTFPITDGIHNYTLTIQTADNSNPDISIRMSSKDPSGSINYDFWDIDGSNNLNATLTFRLDKLAIFPNTISPNTQIRFRNAADTKYIPVDGNNFDIIENEDHYIITVSKVNEF